jgi:aminoacylase
MLILVKNKIINRLLQFRDAEEMRLRHGVREDGQSALTLGDVTTVNLTMLKGGVQYNVVPDYMEAGKYCESINANSNPF